MLLSDSEKLDAILQRLDSLESAMSEVTRNSIAAAASADKSADAATKALLSYESLCTRFEMLRREHVTNHPGSTSQVPATLRRKARK